jgi:gamma-glutamyl phosphate reductase (GPR) (glutamate-5-semialdehyde dehydrogenase) (glutamyl-gamma-semialdehydedehydrogenase) (GSA dehydrogenase)
MRKWVEVSLVLAKVMEQKEIELLAPKLHLANGKEIRLSLEIVDKTEVQEKGA